MCGIMYRDTYLHISRKIKVCACRKAYTQTHSHALSVVNGIKHLGDNSPDGQTRNQASISTPASSSPYPLTTLSLSHIHTDTSPIPGTIIIYSTYCSKAITKMAICLANKSNSKEPLDCQAQQQKKNVKFACSNRASQIWSQTQSEMHTMATSTVCVFFLCSSPPPGPLLPNHMTDLYHLFPHTLRWG